MKKLLLVLSMLLGARGTFAQQAAVEVNSAAIKSDLDATLTALTSTGIVVQSHAVTQSGSWTVTISGNPVLGAGSSIIGKVGIDQTTDGTTNKVYVGNAVAVTGTFWQATQPVSGTFWQTTQPVSLASIPIAPTAATSANQATEIASLASIDGKLVSGPSTATKQDTGNTSLASIDGKLTNPLPISGTVTTGGLTDTQLRASAVPVSLASVPSHAVTNAGTFTVQATEADGANTTLGTKTDARSTATDTTSVSAISVLKEISFANQAAVTALGSPFQAGASIGNTAFGISSGSAQIGHLESNQTVNVAQVGGTNAISAGVVGALAVGGCVATNVATPCNPINLGAQGVSSENSAATTSREVQLVADLVGKLIVLPYSNPENDLQGVTAAITDTTSTQIIAAQSGSNKIYVTDCIVTNSSATVGTFIKILDGSTIIDEFYAAPNGGGANRVYPKPRHGTAATALNVQAVTTGANFIASCGGYKGI